MGEAQGRTGGIRMNSTRSDTPPRYPGVSVRDRIFNILGTDPIMLDDLDSFEYTWERGYETLKAKREGAGGLEYAGAYHPGDGSCVGEGICCYCGRTLWN
jgi:hypothetical protein